LACAADYDWLHWSGLRAGSEAETAVAQTSLVQWEANSHDYVLPLPHSWDELRNRLPRNVKESLRKCYNSLKREGHQARLEVAKEPAAVAAGLDHFLRLHGCRASLASNVRHLNVFGSGRARSFLRALCSEMAPRGEARVYLLHVADKVVAARVAFLHGRHLYLYYSGYDVAWGRFGVSTTLVAEAIRQAIDEKLEAVNFSFGTDVSKLRWRPIEVQYREGVQPSHRARAVLIRSGFTLATRGTTLFGRWRHRNRIVRAIAERLPFARSFEPEKKARSSDEESESG
jgi:CelD/BcsL family acetyltransferase involved in cellulose biosynthesis